MKWRERMGKREREKDRKKQQPSTHRTRAILQNAECIRKTIFKVFSLGFYALTSSYYCRSLKLPTFCHVGVLVFFFFFLYFWKLFCSDEHTHTYTSAHTSELYMLKYIKIESVQIGRQKTALLFVYCLNLTAKQHSIMEQSTTHTTKKWHTRNEIEWTGPNGNMAAFSIHARFLRTECVLFFLVAVHCFI